MRILLLPALLATAAPLAAQHAPRVGPAKGTVFVVGGGQIGPEVWSRFIAAAGGPDALIIDVPTAGGDSVHPASHRAPAGLYMAGAKNVVVYPALGWQTDQFKGIERLSLFGTPDGKRNAFVRIPSERIAVIILSDSDQIDARRIADRILDQLIRK